MSANDYRPEVQARRAEYARNPEHQRRKALYLKARGRKKDLVRLWNNENARHVPGGSLDFPEWLALRRSEGAKDYLGNPL